LIRSWNIFSVFILILILNYILLGCSISHAGGAGTSGAEFLNIDVGPRAVGMGGAYSSIADDPSACYWNPAGLADIKGHVLMLQHNRYYLDLKHEFAAYCASMGNKVAVGISASYLHMSPIDGYDASDRPTGEFQAYDLYYGLSIGYRPGDDLNLGVGVKGIQQALADVKAFGWALDAGAIYHRGCFDFSLVLSNFGPPICYERERFDLPIQFRLGICYQPLLSPFIIAAEWGRSGDGTERAVLGTEYVILDCLSLRTGYCREKSRTVEGRFTFGGGLRLLGHSVDYSYKPDDCLGDIHQLSATIYFKR
jgi:hypothetical protein